MGKATTGSVSTEAYEVRVVQLQNNRLALETDCWTDYPFKIDEHIQQYVTIHQTYE